MKKVILTMIVCCTMVMTTTIISQAKTISSVNATAASSKITVTGTAEGGTLAGAVCVYDEDGKTLYAMETFGVNEDSTYSYTVEKKFMNGTYQVKVADYDGGKYATTKVTLSDSAATSNPPPMKDAVPKTGERVPGALLILGLTAVCTCGVLAKKKKL